MNTPSPSSPMHPCSHAASALRRGLRFLPFVLALALGGGLLHAGPEKWADAIEAFARRDRESFPEKGGIVFVGSSSIARWHSLERDFAGLPVVGRGFGGSTIADSVHYADRIVIPYAPRAVVFYAGENDIAAGDSPAKVADDFARFHERVHQALPEARILYISIKPSPSRWRLQPKFAETNALIEKRCAEDPRLAYVDVVDAMLGPDGKPREELFVQDKLHMNAAGYRLWIERIAEALKPAAAN